MTAQPADVLNIEVMSGGQYLTRASIWLAIVAYAVSAAIWLCAGGRARWLRGARWVWTIGCGFFLIHVACAFAFFHHWSHAAVYAETARQTGALTGWNWGGGIYFNYVFAAAWLADVVWWWLAPKSSALRPRTLTALWHGFLFFMVLNGTVVFGHGPVRWLGAFVCGGLAMLWWRQRCAMIATPPAND